MSTASENSVGIDMPKSILIHTISYHLLPAFEFYSKLSESTGPIEMYAEIKSLYIDVCNIVTMF